MAEETKRRGRPPADPNSPPKTRKKKVVGVVLTIPLTDFLAFPKETQDLLKEYL